MWNAVVLSQVSRGDVAKDIEKAAWSRICCQAWNIYGLVD